MRSRRNCSTSSCRLFVIKAARAPTAVVLRYGPSKWCHVIRWDMRRNVFEHGAWFHGRIYEHRCDLSPDGNMFLYGAFKRIKIGKDWIYSYTAVSRPPWHYALELHPGTSTYEVGGRFLDDRRYALGADPQIHRSTNEMSDADWCGYDHRGRTIYTVEGKLYRVVKEKAVELADFTNLEPDPQPAPAAARLPLRNGGLNGAGR